MKKYFLFFSVLLAVIALSALCSIFFGIRPGSRFGSIPVRKIEHKDLGAVSFSYSKNSFSVAISNDSLNVMATYQLEDDEWTPVMFKAKTPADKLYKSFFPHNSGFSKYRDLFSRLGLVGHAPYSVKLTDIGNVELVDSTRFFYGPEPNKFSVPIVFPFNFSQWRELTPKLLPAFRQDPSGLVTFMKWETNEAERSLKLSETTDYSSVLSGNQPDYKWVMTFFF